MSEKLNIARLNATTFSEESSAARSHFYETHAILTRAYMRRLNFERTAQGKAFDVKAFWADNTISDEVIASTFRRPKLDSKGKQVERKGKLVFETSTFNKRDVANAASMCRSGLRTKSAASKAIQTHGSVESAVKNADKLGSILNLEPRMNRAGLVANNALGNDAKNAAINAYMGETAQSAARRALVGTLYGKPVTSADVKTVIEKLVEFENTDEASRAPLTFAEIFGVVVSINRDKGKGRTRKGRTRKGKGRTRKATKPTIEQPTTEQPELLTGTNN